MSSDEGAVLPRQIEKIFKQYGVIKPATWPKLDGLLKQVAARKMRATVEMMRDGGATARVFFGSREFTGSDTAPERALSRALAEALRETGPRQLGLTEDDNDSDDDEEQDDDEPFPEAVRYRFPGESPEEPPAPSVPDTSDARPAPTISGLRSIKGPAFSEELVWNDAGQCWYGKESGERFEGVTAELLRANAQAIMTQKHG